MELVWMQKYRQLVGQMIRFANTYSTVYNKPTSLGADIELSMIQIQTLEYILENEDLNMTELANKLGVPRTTFAKNAQILEGYGLIQRYQRSDNKKNIYLFATEHGKKVYEEYTSFVYENWYRNMFKIADKVPEDDIKVFGEVLDYYSYTLIMAGQAADKLPVYVPVEHKKSQT